MKFSSKITLSSVLFGCLLVITIQPLHATPVTANGKTISTASTLTVTAATAPATNAPPATPTPPSPAQPALKLDDYIDDLALNLKLTNQEKKDVESFYLADGPELQHVFHDDSLTPLQKARKVAELRDARNAKIETVLHDINRQSAFPKIEAKYRVALAELAADGGLVPPPAPAAK